MESDYGVSVKHTKLDFVKGTIRVVSILGPCNQFLRSLDINLRLRKQRNTRYTGTLSTGLSGRNQGTNISLSVY